MRLPDLPTPSLIVDIAAMERNIQRMAAFFADGPCRLRPHFKAHKTPEIARRQLAAGSTIGLTCATVREAEVIAAFCQDILIANEVVTREACARVAALAGRCRMTIAVDSETGLAAISAAAVAAGVTVAILVDVNVGQNRCGVPPGAEALALAETVASTTGVTLAGVMGYEGHLQPIEDRARRTDAARGAMMLLVETAALIRGSDLPCDIVSAGGTGTYDISGRVAGVTEIQAGSYALMDSDYERLGLEFEQALFVLGTVVSRPVAERVVADCGHKSCTRDHGLPFVVGHEASVVVSLNDEHAIISVPADNPLVVGDRILLKPSHVDPTINLHDVLYAVDGDRLVGEWRVEARGYGMLAGSENID